MTIHELKTRIHSGSGRLRSAGVVSVVGIGLIAGTVYAGAPLPVYAPDAGADEVRAASELATSELAASELAAAASMLPGSGPALAVLESDEAAGMQPASASEEDLPDLTHLQERVERVNGAWSELADYYEEEVAPIERVLRRYSRDTALVQRISVALVREANRVKLEPRLLLAVLLVENPWLDPEIRSPVGAIGLMQIMPVHRGGWSECGSDLEDVDANICHGASIFAHYFRASDRDLDRALLRYNGCVNGTNTPNCHQYPSHVFARAGRASVMAWLNQGPVAGSP